MPVVGDDDAVVRWRSLTRIWRFDQRKCVRSEDRKCDDPGQQNFFRFHAKSYLRIRSASTTRPEDFAMPLQDGSRLPLQEEVVRETELRSATAATNRVRG
jgi:hypothetical protein